MSSFTFKHFTIHQTNSALKVGTDAMVLGSFIELEEVNSALDIGTGTGVLSLMIAQKYPNLKISSIEIDELSCLDAKLNFSQSRWRDNLTLIQADFLKYNFSEKFDLIFSNPPFYENSIVNSNSRIAQAKHESHLSFQLLFEKVSKLLTEKGSFWIIMPNDNSFKWIENAVHLDLFCTRKIDIYGKPNIIKRSILVFSKTKSILKNEKFVIRNEDNSYSEMYIQLTKEYHSKSL